MSGSFRLGKVFGINIQLHYSWFLIFAIITYSLALGFRDEGEALWIPVVKGVVTSLFLFASVVFHELAHSVVAIKNGIPVRSITLFFLGGVAQIAREAARPKTEFMMAIAGPLSSLLLAGMFGLIWYLVWGGVEQAVVNPVFWLAWINLALALFNLVPGFPLDGGRILRAILWHRTGNYKRSSRVASRVGQGVAFLLIAVGIGSVIAYMFDEGFNPFNGIWIAFIGWFLHRAATASYKHVELSEALGGLRVGSVMDTSYVAVSPDLTLRTLVQDYVLVGGRPEYVVAHERRLVGMIAVERVKSVPQSRWDTTRVGEVMVPVEKLMTARPEEEAITVLERMDDQDIGELPVVKDGIVLGLINRDRLLHFIKLRSEFRV
jgi:Zn-dependent protease